MGHSVPRMKNPKEKFKITTINFTGGMLQLFDQMVDEGEALNRSELVRDLVKKGILLHRAFHDTVIEKLKQNIKQ